jgi:hypothetical protein
LKNRRHPPIRKAKAYDLLRSVQPCDVDGNRHLMIVASVNANQKKSETMLMKNILIQLPTRYVP